MNEVKSKTERELKGQSCLRHLKNYTVIDIETTGLDPYRDYIIEVAALRVRKSEPVAEYSSLVKPPYPITDFISSFTGITNDMLCDSHTVYKVLPEFAEFIGDDYLVGHNVNFDINFLYDNFMYHICEPMTNDYIDTLRFARRRLSLPNYKLQTLAQLFDISIDGLHRALADCYITMQCYNNMRDLDRDSLCALCSVFPGCCVKDTSFNHYVRAQDIEMTYDLTDEDNIFFSQVCALTGALETMTRAQALQTITNIGGICANSVTKKTNYLILGNLDYANVKNGKSTKLKRAEELILNGYDLKIISEDVFLQNIRTTW